MSNWRHSRDYRLWRVAVIRRDKVCQVCGSNKKRHAHHLNDASNHPLLKFIVDNGITLCGTHHRMFHTSYMRSYQESCVKAHYENFVELYTKLQDEFTSKIVKLIQGNK